MADVPAPVDRTRTQALIFALALVAMASVLLLPTPDPLSTPGGSVELTTQGKASLAVLLMAVILWATEAVAFPITGLLAMVCLVVTGVEDFSRLVEWGFGNTIILFMLGVLLFSAAISETHLLKRATAWMLLVLGDRPALIILAFLLVGALVSAWVSDMAVAALLVPLALAILRDAGAKPRQSNFGKALMIACAWGPLMGGVATPAGCGPNPLTMEFLADLAGISFSFVDWMILGFPAALLMVPCGWLVLLRVFPLEPIDLQRADHDLEDSLRSYGPLQSREVVTLSVFVLMVVLWVFPGQIQQLTGGAVDYLDIRFVAIACSLIFFLPGVRLITWKQAETSVTWGGVILVVTGLAVGKAVHATGATSWLAWVAFRHLGDLPPVIMVFAVVFGVSVLKVLFSSNTVTGAIMVPLLIALADQLGLDHRLVAVPAGITASLSFILVTSTPTNVVPYATGYFSIIDMVKAGLIMTFASSACVTVAVCVVGSLTGLVSL
jgi:solute carrier family 13 (sodium-dependent dicarboxylate transporter), member 2/3/5